MIYCKTQQCSHRANTRHDVFSYASKYIPACNNSVLNHQYKIFDINYKLYKVNKLLMFKISKNCMEFSNLEFLSRFFANRISYRLFQGFP